MTCGPFSQFQAHNYTLTLCSVTGAACRQHDVGAWTLSLQAVCWSLYKVNIQMNDFFLVIIFIYRRSTNVALYLVMAFIDLL